MVKLLWLAIRDIEDKRARARAKEKGLPANERRAPAKTHLHARRTITGWAEVNTADLEAFLARAPAARHQRTYVLRRFFSWAKGRKLILTNPTRRLSLGAQPAFTGTVLDIDAHRLLFARWTSNTTPDRERLGGLLALLHAASNADIRHLRVADIDTTRRTMALAGRPFPTPLDPSTWIALQ